MFDECWVGGAAFLKIARIMQNVGDRDKLNDRRVVHDRCLCS